MNNATVKKKLTFSSSSLGLNDRVFKELLEKSVMATSFGYVITECGLNKNPIVFVNKAFQIFDG